MPAASAQKRARQRANKVSQGESTTSTTQTPEITSPPAPTSNSIPVPQSSAPPSSAAIDFEMFIEFCNLEDIQRFFNTVGSIQEERNLKLIWDRAFETVAGMSWWHCLLIVPTDYNLLQNNGELYPTLRRIALDYLPCQALSVPCEHLFSAGGEVVTKRWAQLGVARFEELQMMKFAWRNNIGNLAA